MVWEGANCLDLQDGGPLNITTPVKGLIQAIDLGKGEKMFVLLCSIAYRDSAANATSHLFFAYLRSLSPDSPRGANGIMGLPISLQQLMESTEYPPESSHAVINDTTKVVMIVDVVSPTPFALLRRAKNFEYRDDDVALQQFSNYDDPIQALTDECRRVLRCISSTNQSNVSNSKNSTSLADPSWSRFEDIGFGSTIEESDEEDGSIMGRKKRSTNISASPRSQTAEWGNRPTTPSWADFLSSGFVDENGNKATSPVFLPPDKMLPPIKSAPRGHSSQSHRRQAENDSQLEPGELASIDRLDLDDSFWWVWISSLAGEEPTSRKAAFGRCALIETIVAGGKWMILEEQVKGAAPEATIGGYIAEKKGFFSTARGRLTRRRSQIKKSPLSPEPYQRTAFDPSSRVTILPDQHARIQAAAAELSRKKRLENVQEQENNSAGAEKQLDSKSKRNSTLSLQPFIMTEASPAMKWANQYDKQTTRAAYLGDNFAGRGSGELLTLPANGAHANGSASTLTSASKERELPAPPKEDESRREISSPVRQTSPPVPEHVQHVREASPVMSSSPPAPTMAPPPLPANPVGSFHSESAVEAAAVPLPSAHDEPAADFVPPISAEAVASRPETPPRPHSRLRKMSMDTSPTQKREKKKAASKGPPPAKSKQPPLGFRQFFGSRRDKSKERFQPAPLSPADPNPAVAAARAALEGRGPAKDPEASSADVAHLSKMRTVNPTRPQPTEQRPITPPASDQEELTTAKYDETTPVAQNLEPEVDHSGPRTRRDEEYDNLSRVDTNERENADREFSNFDQGPLVEQPAFAARESAFMPTPSPQPEAFVTPDEEEPAAPGPFLAYNSVTAPVPVAEHDQEQVQDEEVGDLTKQVSPMDRWAQIRKNAAERAARMSEEHTRRPSHTETKTDDGETSGEESKFGVYSILESLLIIASNRVSSSPYQSSCC